jgi:ubiquinone/menaquinone biosynthesis C-methylase UbiE
MLENFHLALSLERWWLIPTVVSLIVVAVRFWRLKRARTTPAFIPPLGFASLTPLYDVTVSLTCRERLWRPHLVGAVADRCSNATTPPAVLDVGCGTGTLLGMMAKRCPNAKLYGVDPDQAALGIAAAKLVRPKGQRGCRSHRLWWLIFLSLASLLHSTPALPRAQNRIGTSEDVTLLTGFADAIPLPDKFVAVATSSLLFHHLPADVKRRAFREIHRVLADDGEFRLADWGAPSR